MCPQCLETTEIGHKNCEELRKRHIRICNRVKRLSAEHYTLTMNKRRKRIATIQKKIRELRLYEFLLAG